MVPIALWTESVASMIVIKIALRTNPQALGPYQQMWKGVDTDYISRTLISHTQGSPPPPVVTMTHSITLWTESDGYILKLIQ